MTKMTKRDIKETFSIGDISVGDIEVTGHGRIGRCQRDILVVTRGICTSVDPSAYPPMRLLTIGPKPLRGQPGPFRGPGY